MKINKIFVIFVIVLTFTFLGIFASNTDGELITVEGRVILDSEGPVEGVVTAVYLGKNISLNSCKTDEEGNYSFETKKGFVSLVAKASRFCSEEISIDPSEQKGLVIHQDFSLPAVKTLRGVVFNDKGFPVRDAEVRIQYLDDIQRAFTFEEEIGSVITNELGQYEFPFVAEGKPFILCSASVDSMPACNEEMTLSSKDIFDVNIMIGPNRGAVEGGIFDAKGNPIIGAQVILRATADGEMYTKEERFSEVMYKKMYQRTTSDDSGKFSFPGVPFGSVSLLVETLEGQKTRKKVSHFSEKSPTEVEISVN